jgi:hypothetical protein
VRTDRLDESNNHQRGLEENEMCIKMRRILVAS